MGRDPSEAVQGGSKAAQMCQRNREERGDIPLQSLLLLVTKGMPRTRTTATETAAQGCNKELSLEGSSPWHNQETVQNALGSEKRYVLCAHNVERRVRSQLIVHVSIAAPLPLPMQLDQSLPSLFQPMYNYAHLSHLSNRIASLPRNTF